MADIANALDNQWLDFDYELEILSTDIPLVQSRYPYWLLFAEDDAVALTYNFSIVDHFCGGLATREEFQEMYDYLIPQIRPIFEKYSIPDENLTVGLTYPWHEGNPWKQNQKDVEIRVYIPNGLNVTTREVLEEIVQPVSDIIESFVADKSSPFPEVLRDWYVNLDEPIRHKMPHD